MTRSRRGGSLLLLLLQELSVLYDRNGNGEFPHFCTEVLGDRVYFEVADGARPRHAFG